MKKLSLLFIGGLLSFSAMAATGDSFLYNGIKYTVLDESAKTVTTASGYDLNDEYFPGNTFSGALVLPSKVENNGVTYTLTEVGENGFSDQKGITSVEIPNTVEVLGAYAFIECSNLTSVKLPASVKDIGSSGFGQCQSLSKLYIEDLASFSEIDFHSSTANPLYYGADLYLNGEIVTELVVPDGVVKIEDYAFCGWQALTSAEISNSVKEIGRRAFDGCANLKNVIIGSSVSLIGSDGFSDCMNIVEIKVLATVPPQIDDDTFSDYSAVLLVPEGSIEAYRNSEYWKYFTNIQEFAGIKNVNAENDKANTIYKLNGVQVQDNSSVLSPGIYIINGQKVLVK